MPPEDRIRSNNCSLPTQSKDRAFYANAGIPLAADWQLYGRAGYQDRHAESAALPRLANNPNNIPAIYPNGFLPTHLIDRHWTTEFSWPQDAAVDVGPRRKGQVHISFGWVIERRPAFIATASTFFALASPSPDHP